ncbi:putative polysaccharide biosynthesis protein [Aquibacillus kalidii]|uniref:putative polysaccharide biosynthesis protein n=1 Tax=Aquibacillus kalidii TaxID=2762597 RepID=UPI002E2ABAE2|nr:polysaccharide biosynthesis protein [Aquibacillus kalidii]
MASNILRGTLLLTAATFISKFLGMIYTIPFYELVKEDGGALYVHAYTPYNILISISTVGVPLAVSKFVSKYNALGDYYTGRRMFKAGMSLMIVTGILAFAILYIGADFLANIASVSDKHGNNVEDIAMVIRMVSFALIIIPSMSIVRGFFQGYGSMGPTAVSQVIEQIARILFLLVGAYVTIHVFNGTVPQAVGFATFAAFIGGIVSFISLGIFWRKRKPYLDKQLAMQKETFDIPLIDLYKELFRYAGPFVLVGIATPLYQEIDVLTIERAMNAVGLGENVNTVQSNITMYGHKLVIIPVTVATGLALAIIPSLTKAFTDRNRELIFHQINQSLQIVMLLILPAVVGMSLLGFEVYGTFYGINDNLPLNGKLLSWYAPVALLFGLFTVSSSILQGINEQRYALVSLTAGLLLKVLLNVPLIHLFGGIGAVLGTMIAVATAVILNLFKIRRAINFPFKQFIKRSMLIAIFTVIMAITVLLTKWLLGTFINYTDNRLQMLFVMTVSIIVGASVYLWLSYESTLLERVLGNRVRIIDKVFRRKK